MGQPNNGLAKIEMGDIGALGVMGTVLASLGFTEEDSCKIIFEDAEKKEYNVEEMDTPFYTTVKAGKKSVTFTIANPDIDTVVKVMGGTKTGTGGTMTYKAPNTAPVIEQSLKLTPKIGMGFDFPRVLVTAKFTDSMGRNSLLGIEVTCDVLQPTSDTVAPFSLFTVV